MASRPPEGHRAAEAQTPLRRRPSQRRSRERVERMLSCAAEIIAEKGSDALRMSEVAQLADVSIGSLYQYFPDKSAILRTLAEHYNAECRRCVEEALDTAATMDELCAAFAELVDDYYGLFLAEPVIRDIRSGTLADKALRDIEIADSRANGALLAKALQRVRPGSDPEALHTASFLIMHLGEATMRLAISLERRKGDALVAAYKRMALAELHRG
ncbi:MAG: TetR family transcriptional regulator [Hyphomicrobiales bacterium]|nr:TetR family transcriptional regulator [Hyphomicrobiales bacterium]